MKARIRRTGEIVTVVHKLSDIFSADNGGDYFVHDLDFGVDQTDWQALRHQYAGLAMLGILSSPIVEGTDPNPSQEQVAKWAVMQADKLIEELKKKYTNLKKTEQ